MRHPPCLGLWMYVWTFKSLLGFVFLDSSVLLVSALPRPEVEFDFDLSLSDGYRCTARVASCPVTPPARLNSLTSDILQVLFEKLMTVYRGSTVSWSQAKEACLLCLLVWPLLVHIWGTASRADMFGVFVCVFAKSSHRLAGQSKSAEEKTRRWVTSER